MEAWLLFGFVVCMSSRETVYRSARLAGMKSAFAVSMGTVMSVVAGTKDVSWDNGYKARGENHLWSGRLESWKHYRIAVYRSNDNNNVGRRQWNAEKDDAFRGSECRGRLFPNIPRILTCHKPFDRHDKSAIALPLATELSKITECAMEQHISHCET